MSYILDALKKAEAERDPKAAVQMSLAATATQRNRWLVIIAGTALALNVALVAVWLWNEQTTETNAVAQRQSAVVEEQRQTQEEKLQPAQIAASAASNSLATAGVATGAQPSIDPLTTTPNSSAVPLQAQEMQAPKSRALQRITYGEYDRSQPGRLPELSFSTHIYGSEPSFRAVVVNGQRLTEGDYLNNLKLVEITDGGAVFEFDNYWIDVSVVSGWDQ